MAACTRTKSTSRSPVVQVQEAVKKSENTAFVVLLALSVSHLLNDTIQSLISAVYPVLKESYALSFTQIGLITFAFQWTASLLQPIVGQYTDRRPRSLSHSLSAWALASPGCCSCL